MAGAKGRSGGKRVGAGRVEVKPTDDQRLAVEELAACGTTHDQIAKCVGISTPTLNKYFADELANGLERLTSKVAHGVLRRAMAGDNAASFFFLKCRAGWSERQRVEHTGEGGGPIKTQRVIDPNDLTDEQLAAIAAGGG